MCIRRSLWAAVTTTGCVVVACGSSQQASDNDAGVSPFADDGSLDGLADGSRHDGKASDGAHDGTGTGDDGGPEAAPLPGQTPTCSVPLMAADTSQAMMVGDGTPGSCTEQAFAAAVAKGGAIKFFCGGGSVPLTVTQPIQFPTNKDTIIDGGGLVSLDGGGVSRIFELNGPGYRATKTTVTLQNLDILNGQAGSALTTPMSGCLPGGGGAIFVHDGILHVINVTFTANNAGPAASDAGAAGDAASGSGPSLMGGAIYAEGSLGVVVVNSHFIGNNASSGGAIGSLDSDVTLVDDSFANNQATGSGSSSCSGDGGQSGNGNAGAVAIHGGSDGTATICGSDFSSNTAAAVGGALWRSADNMPQTLSIDQTTFDTNTATQSGGALYAHNCNLNITASTLSKNSAPAGGAIQADATTINFVNDTFSENTATISNGGALSLLSTGGTVQSSTFADNHADHKVSPSGFGAAIAGGVALTINDTIFSSNFTQDCTSPMQCDDGMSTGQANVQWPQDHTICTMPDPPCTTSGTTFADPVLGALGHHGGPTQTIVPKTGSGDGGSSAAIGMGKSCPMTDQRGVMRKSDGCTVGAVEVP